MFSIRRAPRVLQSACINAATEGGSVPLGRGMKVAINFTFAGPTIPTGPGFCFHVFVDPAGSTSIPPRGRLRSPGPTNSPSIKEAKNARPKCKDLGDGRYTVGLENHLPPPTGTDISQTAYKI